MMIVAAFVLQAIVLFWAGTAVVWFTVDWRVRPVRLRVWRSVTWLPFTLADVFRGRW